MVSVIIALDNNYILYTEHHINHTAKMNDASKPFSSPLSSAQSDREEPPEPRPLTPAEKRALATRKMIETKKRKKEALLAAGAPPMSGSEASTSTRKSCDSSKRPGMSGPSGHSPRQYLYLPFESNDSLTSVCFSQEAYQIALCQ